MLERLPQQLSIAWHLIRAADWLLPAPGKPPSLGPDDRIVNDIPGAAATRPARTKLDSLSASAV